MTRKHSWYKITITLSFVSILVIFGCTPAQESTLPLEQNPVQVDQTQSQVLVVQTGTALAETAAALTVGAPPAATTPTLGMAVTYDRVDQNITFSYLVGNTSVNPIPGPVIIIDNKVPAINCPEVTTVGNLDNNLDPNEAIACTGVYTITQPDLDAGSVTSIATASAGGNSSAPITTTVSLLQNRALTLEKSADPVTYNNVGENIIYSYVITNSGEATLGPVQFTINDDKFGSAINCGSPGTSLAPGEKVSCNASYLISQADVTAGSVTNNASATDGATSAGSAGTTISNTATTTINRNTTIDDKAVGLAMELAPQFLQVFDIHVEPLLAKGLDAVRIGGESGQLAGMIAPVIDENQKYMDQRNVVREVEGIFSINDDRLILETIIIINKGTIQYPLLPLGAYFLACNPARQNDCIAVSLQGEEYQIKPESVILSITDPVSPPMVAYEEGSIYKCFRVLRRKICIRIF